VSYTVNSIKTFNMVKSGFDHYKASAKARVKSDLKASLKKGERLSNSMVIDELSKRWDLLPDCSREIWSRQTR
jgi:hypothetical protein